MEQKIIDCAVQHIKTFHDQATDEVIADFGEPCQTCPHVRDCNYDWLSVIEPMLSKSAVKISMLIQDKQENRNMTPAEEIRRALKKTREHNKSIGNNFSDVNA